MAKLRSGHASRASSPPPPLPVASVPPKPAKRGPGRPRRRAASLPREEVGPSQLSKDVSRLSTRLQVEVSIPMRPRPARRKTDIGLPRAITHENIGSSDSEPVAGSSRNPPVQLRSVSATTAKPASKQKQPQSIAPQTSLSGLRDNLTSAMKTPSKERSASTGNAATQRKRKMPLSHTAPATPVKNVSKNHPKSSILALAINVPPMRRSSVVTSTTVEDLNVPGSSTRDVAAQNQNPGAIEASRALSDATGLLTPAASGSVADIASQLQRSVQNEENDVEDIPDPIARKDKGKKRAVEPRSPTVSLRSFTDAPEPPHSRASKRPRISEILLDQDQDFASDTEDGATGVEGSAVSDGFHMMDWTNPVQDGSDWVPVNVPPGGNTMYVPQGIKTLIDNMQRTLRAETKARQVAETSLTAELQRSTQAERRVAELEVERDSLHRRLSAQGSSSSSSASQFNPPCACHPEERRKWIESAADDIAQAAMKNVMAQSFGPVAESSAGGALTNMSLLELLKAGQVQESEPVILTQNLARVVEQRPPPIVYGKGKGRMDEFDQTSTTDKIQEKLNEIGLRLQELRHDKNS